MNGVEAADTRPKAVRRAHVAAFAVLVVLCAGVAAGAVALAAQRSPERVVAPAGSEEALAALRTASYVLFRSTALDGGYGALAAAPLDVVGAEPILTPLSCERVDVTAGWGVCLSAERGVITTYSGTIFNDAFEPLHEWRLAGIPSRVRLSPDGTRAAVTVFVTGHSYAADGFSTATNLIDVATGADLGDLEEFRVLRDGQELRSEDFNFWGVTFGQDPDDFHATLATAGRTHLVHGDVSAREVRILAENVECPSRSPDGTRLAYKRRMGEGSVPVWQIHVLDLSTLTSAPVAETRHLDDQIQWLDDERLLYALPRDGNDGTAVMDTWVVPADGSGQPRLFAREADSLAVVHAPVRGAVR